jgi:hypothetical protein
MGVDQVHALKKLKGVGITAIVAVVAAFLTFSVANRFVLPGSSPQLIAGTNFTISSAITESPACAGATQLLYPGVMRCLTYTVSNPSTVPITVSAISLSIDPGFPPPPGCPASNLDLSHTAFSGSLVVPASGTNTVNTSLSLVGGGAGGNQNGCKNVTFHFLYAGSATYTQLFATTTALASSSNPQSSGQSITFTATITTTGTPPSGPTGTVTFFDSASAISAATPVNASGQAQFSTTSLAVGTHPIKAVYSNSDGNFAGSTSSTVSQVVSPLTASTTSVLTSTANPSVFGQSVTLDDKVTSSSGTPTGSVTFFDGINSLGASNLNATGVATLSTTSLLPGTHSIKAIYSGNPPYVTSTANTVSQVVNYTSACVTGSVNGSLTVSSGQVICLAPSGRINGGVTVKSGGTLFDNGGTINGGATVQSGAGLFVSGGTINGNVSAAGANHYVLCGATINGGVSSSSATGFVQIGDDLATGCPGNTINGGVTLTGNLAGVEVALNTINGGITLTSNTGAGPAPTHANPAVDANKINGNLGCTANNPVPTNNSHKNTGNGTRTGQCAGF